MGEETSLQTYPSEFLEFNMGAGFSVKMGSRSTPVERLCEFALGLWTNTKENKSLREPPVGIS
jgi:hypothetical protein